MATRELAGHSFPPIGLGFMNLIDESVLESAGTRISEVTVSGPRYPEATQREIDTEQFPDSSQRREAGA